jgi:hypothetical protein
MSKGGISRHLKSCAERQAAMEKADAGKGKEELLYHLQVQDGYSPNFWLHLEMRGSAKLGDLDNYLRAIWLECCGHMSQFSFGGWAGNEIAMSRKMHDVLAVGDTLTHIYDFGTSSETLVNAVDARQGKPLSKKPIYLMARNQMPEAICMECDKPAAYVCMECIYEENASGFLCEEHAETHPHDDYGEPMGLYNSPRTGMCGYDGPAEPPY